MFKFLKDFVYIFVFLISIELLMYIKDYNNVMIMKNYIEFDYKKGIESFKIDNYEINIYDRDYEIIYYRTSIFNINFFQKIQYRGII